MTPLKQEAAEIVAVQALGWIAGDEDTLMAFLNTSGANASDLKTRTDDPEFLISVLDFLMMDDAWVTGFCDAYAYSYERPFEARQSLPGGAHVHWT